ncbi:MAG: tol-pal system protein YbgF [Gammaproteobacteria bacterium]|jgi:tol-pal system protein YbgF|nr:tol-pal system protein YbgF [Gammaproteobacteria bacterium]
MSGCTLLQPPSEDPALIRIDELERRLETIERIVDNQGLAQLTQQVDTLERRADQLQGNAEMLQHDAENTADRQRQLYADLDSRIQALERRLQGRGSSVLEGGTLPPGQLPVPDGSDRDNYQVAFELLKEERYELAAASFKQFLVTFPDSGLADNAQYWLAESYYASDKFEQALRDFQVVIDDYPRSRKVPDALLKMGYCNYSLKQWDAARVTLTRVQAEYPETTAARLAGQYLKRMDSEGV